MSDVTLQAVDGGKFGAYLASPASGTGPGIVLIQEIFGVNAQIRARADALAAEGFFVICPDLFWRQQPGIQLTDKSDAEWARAFELYKGFNEALGVEDLIAALSYLRKVPGCTGRVGSVGYCLGGKLAYLMATRSSADCNVGYYGVGIDGALNEIGAINHPLMLHIAEEDEYCPPAAQAQIKAALAPIHHVDVYSYPFMSHAFAREGGAHWNAAAAKLANQRTLAFFNTYLRV